MNITFTSTTNGITVIENTVSVSSGTWNLLGKIEEFKKNERVVFNTLSENITNSTTIAGNTDSSSESYTYANREEAEIMLVVEFKR